MNRLVGYLSRYFKPRDQGELDAMEWRRLLDKAKRKGYSLQWVADKYGAYKRKL